MMAVKFDNQDFRDRALLVGMGVAHFFKFALLFVMSWLSGPVTLVFTFASYVVGVCGVVMVAVSEPKAWSVIVVALALYAVAVLWQIIISWLSK